MIQSCFPQISFVSRGYKAAAFGVIPYASIDLATFETLKENYVYEDVSSTGGIKMVKVACCAIVSTSIAQTCAYPFFLIKSRQQAASK